MLIFPGISRSQIYTDAFDTFASYSATYGAAFNLGNMISRVYVVYFPWKKNHRWPLMLSFTTALVVINSAAQMSSSSIVVFVLAERVGAYCGALYTHALYTALDTVSRGPAADQEFSLGVVGVGDAAGAVIGGLLGAIVDARLCGTQFFTPENRWCHQTR